MMILFANISLASTLGAVAPAVSAAPPIGPRTDLGASSTPPVIEMADSPTEETPLPSVGRSEGRSEDSSAATSASDTAPGAADPDTVAPKSAAPSDSPAASSTQPVPAPTQAPHELLSVSSTPDRGQLSMESQHEQDRSRQSHPQRRIRNRFEIMVGYMSSINIDDSYLGFADDRQLSGLELGLRLDHRIGERFYLGTEASYRSSASEGTTYGNIFHSTTIALQEPALGLRATFVPVEGVDIYLRASGGPLIADLDWVWGEQSTASQRVVTGSGNALVGGLFYLPRSVMPRRDASRLTLGLDLGVGYNLRGSIDVEPDRGLDTDPISTEAPSLGAVKTGGFAWRVGLFIRFD